MAGQRLWLTSYLRRPMALSMLIAMVLLFSGATAVAVYQIAFERVPTANAFSDNAVPIAVPVLFMGLQLSAWWRVPGTVRRTVRQQPNLLSETTWRWNDETIVAESAAGSSIVRWKDLHRWMVGHSTIILMPQERLLLTLPLRLVGAGQADDLTDVLNRFAKNKRWPKATK